jgi:hypothetical protein
MKNTSRFTIKPRAKLSTYRKSGRARNSINKKQGKGEKQNWTVQRALETSK